ncbi:MAG: hypothetical protein ABEH65_05170 [Halobacteriales archaeon]
MVAASLAVEPDVDTGRVRCGRCQANDATDDTLVAGDEVTVALSCYDNHSWEILDIYCADHRITTIEETMDIGAVEQAVATAVLEPTGYQSPDGRFYPNALTLGAVAVLDYSPTAEGY